MTSSETFQAAANPPVARTPASGPSLVGVLVGAGGIVVAVWAAVLTAVVSAFLSPLRIGPVPVPFGWVVVVAGTVAAVRLARFSTGSRFAALAPAAAWLVTVVVLASPRREGDVVVPGTWVGYGLLLIGTVAMSSAVFVELATRPSPR